MQSGLMTLPFTFWNYSIAASNKILLAGLDEPSSQKLGGIAAIVGLGWMVAQVRTPAFAWDNMSFEDKMKAAVDQSGVMGVMSQYSELAQGSAIGLTGRNPLPFEPANGHDPSLTDAAFNLMGAGPSAARNLIQGVAQGDLNRASWGMAYRNHILTKDLFDAAVDGLERRDAGLD